MSDGKEAPISFKQWMRDETKRYERATPEEQKEIRDGMLQRAKDWNQESRGAVIDDKEAQDVVEHYLQRE